MIESNVHIIDYRMDDDEELAAAVFASLIIDQWPLSGSFQCC
jgi:hypothetical protein